MTNKLFLRHEVLLALLLILTLIVLGAQSDRFLTLPNILNQGRLMTEVGLISVAMTFVILIGGIDLSVGSIMGLSAILLGVFWQNLALPLPLVLPAVLLVGTLAGLVNGIVITKFKVPPLITTLATLALYRGLAEGISQARSVRGYPDWFALISQGEILGIPGQLLFLLLVVVGASVMLWATPWGRSIYAVGLNETSARFSGLAVDRTKLIVYSASGFAAALAAIIFVSRVSTTRSDMGSGIELDAITAVVLGGTSIFGGRGTVIGTFIGLCLIQTLKNGSSLAGIKGDGTIVLIGVVLILATVASSLFGRGGTR
ncbi:MAG: ABC transporter permease [Devosia sp.]